MLPAGERADEVAGGGASGEVPQARDQSGA